MTSISEKTTDVGQHTVDLVHPLLTKEITESGKILLKEGQQEIIWFENEDEYNEWSKSNE